MNFKAFLRFLACSAACTLTVSGAPIAYEEISLRLRTGDAPQAILQDVTQRKLLKPLSPQQEGALASAGAAQSFITALRAKEIQMTAQEAAAFEASQHAGGTPDATAADSQDPFKPSLEAAKSPEVQIVTPNDAFNLDHLDQAMAKARAEKKPLGFILVWNQYFNVRSGTRAEGGNSALLHFYRAFKDPLVLVFVHHETDLAKVPRAVSDGYNSPDEGGYAPNMAVVDATAKELIVEVPMGGPHANGAVRDEVFSKAAARIRAWLAQHPDAAAN